MNQPFNSPDSLRSRVCAVAIGRNEGERLKACLRSLVGVVDGIVYVDSGSTDASVEFARNLGVDVVELDMSKPFTMARARNAGFERLLQLYPMFAFVQFVDGDCKVEAHWIASSLAPMLDDSGLVSNVPANRPSSDRQ